jgi:GT2 family glycosyltransferase
MASPTIGLIITAHENPKALRACLWSISRQTKLPNSVYVVEDGDSPDVAAVIASAKSGTRLVHLKQEHRGFRAGAARNKGIAHSSEDYLIFVDGDSMLDPHMVQDHASLAQPGTVLIGPRCGVEGYFDQTIDWLPGLAAVCKMLASSSLTNDVGLKIPFGSARALAKALRLPLAFTFDCPDNRVFSGNMSAYRNDLLKVNGFDESFVGWGFEDMDLGKRLARNGCKVTRMVGHGVVWHINHPRRDRTRWEVNKSIAEDASRPVFCQDGVSRYLQ